MFYHLDSVHEVKNEKYHLYMTNTSRRTVSIPFSALGEDITKKIFAPLENGRKMENIEGCLTAIQEEYFELLPAMAIGIKFENEKSLNYFVETHAQVLQAVGVLLTDDTEAPFSPLQVMGIIALANEEKQKASIQDSKVLKDKITQSTNQSFKNKGLGELAINSEYGKA